MVWNPRVTKKERNLIKGALRRVFSRSDLRNTVLDTLSIEFVHPVSTAKRWCYCPECGVVTPRYKMEVDHILPVQRIGELVENLDPNMLVDRMWCEENNLQGICRDCHGVKSKREMRARREFKKANNPKPTKRKSKNVKK